jgi:hypothetical protein
MVINELMVFTQVVLSATRQDSTVIKMYLVRRDVDQVDLSRNYTGLSTRQLEIKAMIHIHKQKKFLVFL